ncbi:MAG TPA: hypothetical protein VMW53_11175 [archaeon]|nr:hypothetical protein [archaeon]
MEKTIHIECENIIDVYVTETRGGRIHFKLNLNENQFRKLKEEVKKHEEAQKIVAV